MIDRKPGGGGGAQHLTALNSFAQNTSFSPVGIPIVRVHRPTKAFLERTLVFSSSPSEHQAALFQ